MMVSAQNAEFTRNRKTNTTTHAAAKKQQTTENNHKQHVQSASHLARISQELRTESFSANGVSFKMCYEKVVCS